MKVSGNVQYLFSLSFIVIVTWRKGPLRGQKFTRYSCGCTLAILCRMSHEEWKKIIDKVPEREIQEKTRNGIHVARNTEVITAILFIIRALFIDMSDVYICSTLHLCYHNIFDDGIPCMFTTIIVIFTHLLIVFFSMYLRMMVHNIIKIDANC